MRQLSKTFADGEWQASRGNRTLSVLDSATEQPMAEVTLGSAADIDTAVRAAHAAFPAWSRTTPARRAELLQAIRSALAERAAELADAITGEVGMPAKMSRRMQVDAPLAILDMYARHATAFAYEERVGHSRVLREAAGVVGAITAWNYPLYLLAAKVGPALAAGCTVVLKPSEIAPLSAVAFAEATVKAGLPPGVFNMVIGTGEVAGEALVAHPLVDAVSFTGSTRAGRRVGAVAAEGIKHASLELGGKSASVLLDDADLPAAVKSTVNMCFLNSGQTCAALTRLLVPERLHDDAVRIAAEVARAFVPADPRAEGTRLGPLASAAQRERVERYVARGDADGAWRACGGTDRAGLPATGYFVHPTVFGRVAPESAIAQEEIFGPVLCVIPYRDEDDAVRIANGTLYGLAGAVWSADTARAEAVALRMRTGQVDINGAPFNLEAPFGGYRQSGVGRENGRWGMEAFLETKSVQYPRKA